MIGCGLTLGLLAASSGASAQPWPSRRGEGAVGKTVFRGQELTYEVVDGLAVHGGDIVLGTAAEAAAAPDRIAARRASAGFGLDPAQEETGLWPEGVIPYVIEPDLPNRQEVLTAIEEWNTKTVISLVERTTEHDYVRFIPYDIYGSGHCSADLGMHGGEQFVYLGALCNTRAIVHEIGHTVGLLHEHQRADRDQWLMVYEANVAACVNPFILRPEARIGRPYDLASTMHYGRGPFADLPWLETIPPGLSLASWNDPAPLSSGDVDYVARLYGRPPTRTTISTNPPGLELLVDGVQVTAPATFDWPSGSQHRVEAVSPQSTASGTRYVFGRWTDEGDRAHAVTADPDTTWIQANFIVQTQVTPQASPPEAGTVTISPQSPDGFYTVGTRVELTAVPNSGYAFVEWLRHEWSPNSGFIAWVHGRGRNPTTLRVGGHSPPTPSFGAIFTDEPVFSIGEDGYEHGVAIGYDRMGRVATTPKNWRRSDFISEHTDPDGKVRVAVLDNTAPEGVWTLPSFRNWSDGAPSVPTETEFTTSYMREINVPREGGRLTVNVETYVPLYETGIDGWGDVTRSPGPMEVTFPSDLSYYAKGTRVQLTARPRRNHGFIAWWGAAYGTDPVTSVLMDYPKRAEALFSDRPLLSPGATVRGDLAAGYWIHVPFGATALEIDVGAVSGTNAVLAVWRGGGYFTGTELLRYGTFEGADFELPIRRGGASVVVIPSSVPPLTHGPYFAAVLSPSSRDDRSSLRGTVTATITPGVEVKTFPKAFTFVSPAGIRTPAQTLELRNLGKRSLSLLIASDQDWLSVEPQLLTVAAGETAEIAIGTRHPGGIPDTHTGTLMITESGRSGSAAEGVRTVPVILAVVPSTEESGQVR